MINKELEKRQFDLNWFPPMGRDVMARALHMLFRAPEIHLDKTNDVLLRAPYGPAHDWNGKPVDPWHPAAACWTFQGALMGAIGRICEEEPACGALMARYPNAAKARIIGETVDLMAVLDVPKALWDRPADRPDPYPGGCEDQDFNKRYQRYLWLKWWSGTRAHTTPQDIRLVCELRLDTEEFEMEDQLRNA